MFYGIHLGYFKSRRFHYSLHIYFQLVSEMFLKSPVFPRNFFSWMLLDFTFRPFVWTLVTTLSPLQLEYQRQELLRERQQFHLEQLHAAEYRAKQMAAQQLALEQRSQPPVMPHSQGPLPPQGPTLAAAPSEVTPGQLTDPSKFPVYFQGCSWTRGQDYKRFLSMSHCSTHNLCSEMTSLPSCSKLSLRFVLSRGFLYNLGPLCVTNGEYMWMQNYCIYLFYYVVVMQVISQESHF